MSQHSHTFNFNLKSYILILNVFSQVHPNSSVEANAPSTAPVGQSKIPSSDGKNADLQVGVSCRSRDGEWQALLGAGPWACGSSEGCRYCQKDLMTSLDSEKKQTQTQPRMTILILSSPCT